MILSRDAKKGGLAIITPTKTGTMSAEGSLVKSGLFVLEKPRHSKIVPESYRKGRIIITIRHPHARLVSAYFYGRKSANNPPSWFYGKADGGFIRFVRAWVKARETKRLNDWTTNLSEYVAAAVETNGAKNVTLHRLEDGGTSGLIELIRKNGYPKIDAEPKHINRSIPEDKSWESFWTAPLIDAVGSHLDVDLALGDYIRPNGGP